MSLESEVNVPQLKHLFQPIMLGSMQLKNRMMMSCMAAGISLDDSGRATDEMGTEGTKATAEPCDAEVRARQAKMGKGASYEDAYTALTAERAN